MDGQKEFDFNRAVVLGLVEDLQMKDRPREALTALLKLSWPENGRLTEAIRISHAKLAQAMGASHNTAASALKQLAAAGLIESKTAWRGFDVSIRVGNLFTGHQPGDQSGDQKKTGDQKTEVGDQIQNSGHQLEETGDQTGRQLEAIRSRTPPIDSANRELLLRIIEQNDEILTLLRSQTEDRRQHSEPTEKMVTNGHQWSPDFSVPVVVQIKDQQQQTEDRKGAALSTGSGAAPIHKTEAIEPRKSWRVGINPGPFAGGNSDEIDRLFNSAQSQGLVGVEDKLEFFALVAWILKRRGTETGKIKSPPGFLRERIELGDWRQLPTEEDKEAALRMLLRMGGGRPPPKETAPAERREKSAEALAHEERLRERITRRGTNDANTGGSPVGSVDAVEHGQRMLAAGQG